MWYVSVKHTKWFTKTFFIANILINSFSCTTQGILCTGCAAHIIKLGPLVTSNPQISNDQKSQVRLVGRWSPKNQETASQHFGEEEKKILHTQVCVQTHTGPLSDLQQWVNIRKHREKNGVMTSRTSLRQVNTRSQRQRTSTWSNETSYSTVGQASQKELKRGKQTSCPTSTSCCADLPLRPWLHLCWANQREQGSCELPEQFWQDYHWHQQSSTFFNPKALPQPSVWMNWPSVETGAVGMEPIGCTKAYDSPLFTKHCGIICSICLTLPREHQQNRIRQCLSSALLFGCMWEEWPKATNSLWNINLAFK